MMKKHWKDSWQYKRILELLDEYWLTEPDELAVYVQLDFVKADGQNQGKAILWMNPNYKRKKGSKDFADCITEKKLSLYGDDHPFAKLDYKDFEKVIVKEDKT